MIKKSLPILVLSAMFMVLVSLSPIPERNYGSIVLMGGSECKEAVKWMMRRTKNNKLLIVSTDNIMVSWLQLSDNIEFLSVPTFEDANSEAVINKIYNAESILIPGGDQRDYVKVWKGSRLAQAISQMATKIPVGGVSAGLAIMGEFYYSAENGTVLSNEALTNPYNKFMADIGSGFLNLPFMRNIITDSHYEERQRQGRHLAFMARILNDTKRDAVRGIGIDENTALCITTSGTAEVIGKGRCYLIESLSAPQICTADSFLTWPNAVRVYILNAGIKFNINKWIFGEYEVWNADNGKIAKIN